jgi:uncharacterized membrane protein YfhO
MSSEVETPEDIWGEKSGTSKAPANPEVTLSSSRKASADGIASTGSKTVRESIDLPSSRSNSIDQQPKTKSTQQSSNGRNTSVSASSDTASDGSNESSNSGQSSASTISSIPESEKRPLFSALISFEGLEFKLLDPLPFNAF